MDPGFSAQLEPLHSRMMSELCDALDDMDLDPQASIRLADDETLVAKCLPFDLLPSTENVPLREGDK
jgi:hypothetical protein